MKKIIYSAFALAIMALTFTSCEDVPAPFDTNYKENNGGNKENPIDPSGEGTEASPYNVAKALEVIKAGTQPTTDVYIKGIITGIKEIDTEKYGNASYYIGDTKDSKTTFYIYRSKGLGGEKFTTGKEIAVGDTVVVKGIIINYNGTPETDANKSQLVSINGKTGNNNTGGNTDDTKSTATPSGDGTAKAPYNVAKAQSILETLAADAKTEDVYISGTIVGKPEINTQYGNATYYLADDKSGKLSVFRGYSFNGDKFTATDQLKEGDKVTIVGKLINFKGNTPQVNTGSKIVVLNGKEASHDNNGGNNNTGGNGTTGEELTAALITSGATGSITLDTGKYGNQKVADESTWYTWKFNNITYKAVKACVSDGKNGEGIQLQGNDKEAANQGFIFNADAFGSDIKTVTIVMSIANNSKYDPSYNFYAGTTPHPMANAIAATPTKTKGETYTDCTYVFDLSQGSYKYFTIANNKVGAVYVKSIKIALK